MDLSLSIKETLTIRPCQPTKRQTVELSGLDRISPSILYTIFFFKCLSRHQSYLAEENGLERIKEAMARLLVLWFPAAGRFRINEGTGKLVIDCTDEGVTMIIAEADSKLEELGRLYDYKPSYEKLVPQLPEAEISENPLIVVQITRFACGGFSIGLGASHSLFDGAGAFNFLASWAHIASGKDESLLILPNHSRDTLLQATYSPNSSPASASIYEQDHIVAIQDLYGIPMQVLASDDKCWETALAKLAQIHPQGGLELVTLCAKKEVVETLKRLALEKGHLLRCSTFDVLTAHIWKARVKALNLHEDTNICLQFPVNSRSRLNPPLGDNFTGNAFVLASVSSQVKNLLEEPLHKTIQKIQAAKDMITDEYIRLYTKALECSDKFFPSMRELTIVTDWLKFPIHALDFGWGKVSSAALLATPVPETAFLMENLEEPHNFLVRMGIRGQEAQNLISHFNNFNY